MKIKTSLNDGGAAHKESGFTLIEVLASLMVFSFAIVGLTASGTQSARAASALEDKSLAGIIADNQLVLARKDSLKLGVLAGEDEIMLRTYNYRLETETTDVSGFFKMTVKVQKPNDPQVIVERVAYRRSGS